MPSLISLTQGQTALVDDADYEWLNQWKWYVTFYSVNQSYYAMRISPTHLGKRHPILMHRQILGLEHGDKREGDHIHHNTLDNRRSELRVVTHRQNSQNLKRPVTSVYPGVSWCSTRAGWRTGIQIQGKIKHLGVFQDEIEAKQAYERELACL